MRPIDADALKKDIARLHILNDEAEIRKAYASNPYSTLSDFEDTLVSVFDDIDDAPTVDAVSEWIPCSERLPANDDWVIVSVFDECGDIPYRYSDFGWYLEVAKCWIVDSEQRTDVVAWMPLPAPCSM